MGIFYNPPPPFIGGAQPYEGRKSAVTAAAPPALLPKPPPWSMAALAAIVAAAWVAPDPMPFMGGRQPLQARQLAPSLFTVPDPSGNAQVMRIVEVAPVMPQQPGKLNPALLDNPATFVPQRATVPQAVHVAWQPGAPLPQLSAKLVLPYTADTVLQRPNVPQAVLHAAWQPGPPLPQLNTKLVLPYTADTILKAPRVPQSVAAAWQPPDPSPQQKGTFNPAILSAATADNPPFNGTLKIVVVPADPLPQVNAKLPQPFVADNPPFSSRRLQHWPQWVFPDPLPTLSGKLNPTVLAVPVNEPSGFNVLKLVIQPHGPLPTLPPKVAAILATPAQVDNPPFQHMGRWPQFPSLVLSWQPPDPPPVQRGPLNPSFLAVPVNNPPFTSAGRTPTFMSISAAWTIPPPPQPQQTTFINPNTPSPPPPPVTTGEFTVSGRDVVALFPVYDVAYTYNPVSKRTN